jgi:hypothetical protein
MPKDTSLYYNKLATNSIALNELFRQDHLFEKVPEDWNVIITDIRNSTLAVLDGSSQNVNLVATGSIVVVLNIAFKNKISVPFFFGGDGATFIVPAAITDLVVKALLSFKENTKLNFGFDLRVGMVPVNKIYQQGCNLKLSKFNISEYFSIPILLGNGLEYAEKIIKGDDYLMADKMSPDELDLSGMQCRWDKIAPPNESNEIVTLLIVAAPGANQANVFGKVMLLIDNIYGTQENRQPISVSKLKLKTTFNRLKLEMFIRLGKIKFVQLIESWLVNLIGYFYLKSKKGKIYLDLLVKMSDTLVIDGKINTVISGTEAQRNRLITALDLLENESDIIYGIHISRESIMSCYVRDMKDGHIHFVDGADGGYTMAAKVLKVKLRNQLSNNPE